MNAADKVEPDQPGDRVRKHRQVRALSAVAAVVAIAVAVAATLGLGGRADSRPGAGRTGPEATTTVTRQNLIDAKTLTGTLNYGGAMPLTCTATGTVTWLPDIGANIIRGNTLLRVDDQPVVLLYGSLPMYRQLGEGVKGDDVRQLERNLSALGYTGFTVDDDFSHATTIAVKKWQTDLGLTATGVVDREQVIYASTAIRIAQLLVRPGMSASADVASYTGNTRVVTISASADEAAWAVAGTMVTVTLPAGIAVSGRVTGVTSSDQPGTAPTDSSNSTASGGSVTVTVAVANQKALGKLDNVSVDVQYVAKERKSVLTVPVAALLALTEGGYGVEVVEGGTSRVVSVTVGMFAGGRAEISGSGIDAGTVVGMPA